MKRALLAMVSAVMLLSASAGHAARTETLPYQLGPIGDNSVFCNGISRSTPAGDIVLVEDGNYGGACFAVEAGETALIATIADDVMPAVGLTVTFHSSEGVRIGDPAGGCVEARASIPQGAASIRVRAHGAVTGALACGLPLPATSGEITVEFS